MTIHVAITRRVKEGKEQEFQDSLRRFLGESFVHGGVHGAGMITSLPGAHEREIGILRTFRDTAERDAFYASDLFKEWEQYASSVTEGEAHYHDLTGLEAFFRGSGNPPPRWKMAVVTLMGVYPASLFLTYFVAPFIHTLPVPLKALIIAACMVGLLTWVIMPNLVKWVKPWLHKSS